MVFVSYKDSSFTAWDGHLNVSAFSEYCTNQQDRQCTCNVAQARSRNHGFHGKAVSYICACVRARVREYVGGCGCMVAGA